MNCIHIHEAFSISIMKKCSLVYEYGPDKASFLLEGEVSGCHSSKSKFDRHQVEVLCGVKRSWPAYLVGDNRSI